MIDEPNIVLSNQLTEKQIPVNSDEEISAFSKVSPDEFKSYVEKIHHFLLQNYIACPQGCCQSQN